MMDKSDKIKEGKEGKSKEERIRKAGGRSLHVGYWRKTSRNSSKRLFCGS